MGGDFIGSDLVRLSTGVDFVEKVIQVALGIEPVIESTCKRAAGVRFVFGEKDMDVYHQIRKEHPEYIFAEELHPITDVQVVDSSTRFGYYLLCANDSEMLHPYLPDEH